MKFVKGKCDALVVVGGDMKSQYVQKIVNWVLAQNTIPVVWINNEPMPEEKGFRINLKDSCENALPVMLDELMNLKSSQ